MSALNRETEDALDDLREYYLGVLDKKDAEIERLHNEIAQLRANDEWCMHARTEIERLRAEKNLAVAMLEGAEKECAELLAVLQLIRVEFKEFLGEDRRSRMVRDRIDVAIAKAKTKS